MQTIQISDQLFSEAVRKAASAGMSIERFVADAVQLHLHDELDESESVRLTPEQVAIIRRSQTEIREGKGLTMDQVKSKLEANKAAWLKSGER